MILEFSSMLLSVESGNQSSRLQQLQDQSISSKVPHPLSGSLTHRSDHPVYYSGRKATSVEHRLQTR